MTTIPAPIRAAPVRPLVLAVVGTATEIGKTWFTAYLINELRGHGSEVAVRKPVQSYDLPTDGETDAELLAIATGEHIDDVCPPHRWYPEPMAPPMAADALGLDRIRSSDLISDLRWPETSDVRIVETVGGVRSPLSHDIDSAGFAHMIGATHAVLVADAGLGTINAIRLAMHTIHPLRTLVYLNRYDDGIDLHRRNMQWLVESDGYAIATDIEAAARWLLADHEI